MGIPATADLLLRHPGNTKMPPECTLQGLEIVLNNNYTQHTDSEQTTVYAKPIRGTAMGPSQACDYVDIFMGVLDKKLVDTTPVPLLSSLATENMREELRELDWTRFRDDGFIILPDSRHLQAFEKHLQELHPPNIKWTVTHGKKVNYLDTTVELRHGVIHTDVFSKNNHCYLPPSSCHAPPVFKGLISGMGTRLRMICSDENTLETRLDNYADYFASSGWNRTYAKKELERGATKNRDKLLLQQRKKKLKKLAWVTTYDPRVPSKSQIIKRNLQLLYTDSINRTIFPPKSIISADRRRRNLSEIYKPTVPNRFPFHGPLQQPGFYRCKNKCDTCAHAEDITFFVSPWDGRTWHIRQHITCTTENVIYVLKCKLHPQELYIGSTKNLKRRWANHKSDIKLNKCKKCKVVQHVVEKQHPKDSECSFLQIFPVEAVKDPTHLLRRELWWQTNVGTLITGLNTRNDFQSMLLFRNRILF